MAEACPSDDETVALLEHIVRIPSVSGDEAAVASACVAAMDDMGLQAHIDPAGNAVGTLGSGPLQVILLGHIDTVPGQPPVRREGDWLFGRGAVDAKGPFVAMMCAVARAGELDGLRLTVIGAVEEESATSRGAYYVVNHYAPAAAVIIGEPSRWDRVTLGYKGRLLVDYELSRAMSHTAGRAPSVCERAVAYWGALREWSERYNEQREALFDRLDVSLREINSRSDGLLEHVRMCIGLRLPPGLDPDYLSQRLSDWAGEGAVTVHGRELPFRASNRNALTSSFLAAIRAEGGRPAFVTKTGTSDMNVIGPRWRCPIVAYGPGDSAYDHTPEERIQISEFLRAIRVLTGALHRLGSTLRATIEATP